MGSTLAILLSLVLLMYLAYRGITVLLLAPLMAALAVLLSGDAGFLLPIYTNTFMSALSNYVLSFLPIFLLGALFGQLMADSGAANSIAQYLVRRLGDKHAISTVVAACAILTYGGVSLFVVAFAIYPIAKDLFQAANIPKRLVPASIALGSFTFTMTALPGTPSIQNAIPIPYYGTNVFAAPGLGIIGSIIMAVGGLWWLQSRAKKAAAAQEGYGEHPEDAVDSDDDRKEGLTIMPVALALLPLFLVIGVNALFTYGIFPGYDFSTVTEKFPSINPKNTVGLWALIIALVVANASLVLIRLGRWHNLRETVNKGIFGFMLPLFNTASEVGYGAVIASLTGFVIIRDFVLNVAPGNPLISEAVAMTTLAGITGSSSGGLSIALQTLGSTYLEMAHAAGISPELLHRVAVMSAGGLDTLPHCGAIITLLSICRLNHRQSYANIAMVTMVWPLLAVAVVIALGTMFGSF
ncbi:GntP family permease [Alcaligenes endophyticus]|uniref:GntP family permease n=1 Tax=Alcaligenes endophyticus TaxID=1929088 RepID=A0ABT8EIP8_9BURK|nr:GntP family permease [Alcaligenes endophyticus]MCX5592442.1 GntP family permease [Alcaligenes endophyticus]MDN4121167.1 GntP family permease [Alcaligenes endophyticus]